MKIIGNVIKNYIVHEVKKRRFNLLVDLQKAYDSVDRVILWKLLKQRCQS
jgi:hypothetical protein